MGYYINGIGVTYQQKIDTLVIQHEAEIIETPKTFQENLVCVVNNGAFAAAGWMNDEKEFQQWILNDGRQKCWMIVPHAESLAKN